MANNMTTLKNVVIEIVEATPAHLKELAKTMRAADRKEINCLGVSTIRGLMHTFRSANIRKTILVDGKVAAFCGLGGVLLSRVGKPFLLTSIVAETIPPITFVRIYKQQLKEMLNIYPCLENYVDSSYDKSIKLLQMCGFQIGEPIEVGKNIYFRKFSMECVR